MSTLVGPIGLLRGSVIDGALSVTDQGVIASRGVTTIQTIPQPAVGAELSIQVPVGQYWRIMSIAANLATSAQAGTRQPAFVITDAGGARLWFGFASTVGIGPNVNPISVEAVDGGFASASLANIWYPSAPLPSSSMFTLQPGWIFETVTNNFQTGDQWAAAKLVTRVASHD